MHRLVRQIEEARDEPALDSRLIELDSIVKGIQERRKDMPGSTRVRRRR